MSLKGILWGGVSQYSLLQHLKARAWFDTWRTKTLFTISRL